MTKDFLDLRNYRLVQSFETISGPHIIVSTHNESKAVQLSTVLWNEGAQPFFRSDMHLAEGFKHEVYVRRIPAYAPGTVLGFRKTHESFVAVALHMKDVWRVVPLNGNAPLERMDSAQLADFVGSDTIVDVLYDSKPSAASRPGITFTPGGSAPATTHINVFPSSGSAPVYPPGVRTATLLASDPRP